MFSDQHITLRRAYELVVQVGMFFFSFVLSSHLNHFLVFSFMRFAQHDILSLFVSLWSFGFFSSRLERYVCMYLSTCVSIYPPTPSYGVSLLTKHSIQLIYIYTYTYTLYVCLAFISLE